MVMHIRLKLIVAWLLLTASQLVPAQTYSRDQYLTLIEEYVNKTTNIYDRTWAYSYITYDKTDDSSFTRRIDPGKPFMQSDVLLSENDGPPSAEGLERHEKRMQRRLRRIQSRNRAHAVVDEELDREGSEKERFLALIVRDSLELVHRDGDIHTLRFKGMEENRRKIYEYLEGTLILDTGQEFIRELQIRVTAPFSPFFLTRVDAAHFFLRFELRDGIPIQSDASWHVDARILYVKDLAREKDIVWKDITPVVPGDNI